MGNLEGLLKKEKSCTGEIS